MKINRYMFFIAVLSLSGLIKTSANVLETRVINPQNSINRFEDLKNTIESHLDSNSITSEEKVILSNLLEALEKNGELSPSETEALAEIVNKIVETEETSALKSLQ